MPDHASPIHKGDVSGTRGRKTKIRSYTISGGRGNGRDPRTQKQYIYVDDDTDDAYVSPRYEYREPTSSKRYSKPSADQYFYYGQNPYEEVKRTRRRSSTSKGSPQKPGKSSRSRPPVKATEEDAIAAGIPAGYSIKNWDPTESPIILLGSVFDANSLGKWIYDWTVYHHGASTPMADVAGDLWLLLIKLAGKMKRAEECVHRIRSLDNRDMVVDFIESGSRLWVKFKDLLKECERYMWKAAKREGGKGVSMGKNAGTEFVESIFGRDRQLETTEKLMNSIRLWNMRFDANCEEILRRPSAL
ncbi:putative vegetative cell wall protein gp1 [Phaeomoniella chlamydospora]|uniref:Putative vegetative cell wall protein gp1 n=1 Tax=Phaeomoniella chlamydospora TaxID=158046 RepID=A0A0G2GCX4_PHACM|nr:putative vegetative cell wall protein gp1 [Phaeomoniella chlamydospora]